MDAILDNKTELKILDHTTDTAGYTKMVFALFDLLGLRFSPHLKDIQDKNLRPFESIDISKYRHLKTQFKEPIKTKKITDYWDELLRVTGSLKTGWVTASLLIKRLQAYPQKNVLVKALQEYGDIVQTNFILKWYTDEEMRRGTRNQLNKGEALHSLRTKIFFANKGTIRKHHEHELLNQSHCLNLVVNAVIIWNTVYMQAVIEELRKENYAILEEDVKHLWPTRHNHINVHGKYHFDIDQALSRQGLRPLKSVN